MKIGIITFQKCNNFGADLQAFALQKKLQLMGYDAENIDYLFYKDPKWRKTSRGRPSFKLSLVNRVKEWLLPKVNAVRGWRNRQVERERRARFVDFFNRNVKVSRQFRCVDELYADPPHYDVYVTGSDQVWNPRAGASLEPYFLTFAPKTARKISYASSFGVSSLPPSAYKKYSQWLESYSAISVREESGRKIASQFVGCVRPSTVVDPTLLLTAAEWETVSVRPSAKDYLLVYDLNVCPGLWKLARRWATELGVEIKRICRGVGCEHIDGVENIEAVGPAEFVGLLRNARTVVTTSFHGTVFSLIFEKPFYSVIPKAMTNASRIEDLLTKVGLADRLVREQAAETTVLLSDAGGCASRLAALRDQSAAWLRMAIEGNVAETRNRVPVACYAAWSRDESERASATSGGAFAAMASRVIARGGVVFGAAFDEDYKYVRHIGVETVEELEKLKKSKYVWSDPGKAYQEIPGLLKTGREVLFSGTPCQCAAVGRFSSLGKLTTIDFVCHGTPRPDTFAAYADGLERRYGSKLVDYLFREKLDGWNFQRIAYRFANGLSRRVMPWLDPYFRDFSLNVNLRPGCLRCPYAGIARPSDITIADCWRVAASHPEYDDNKGTSNVLVNTERGIDVWREIEKSGLMEVHPYDLRMAQMCNHALMEPSHVVRRKPMAYYVISYWVKRIAWCYLRRHQ